MGYITPAEFEEKVKELAENWDEEIGHIKVEEMMKQILRQLGYDAGIDIYEKQDVWFS